MCSTKKYPSGNFVGNLQKGFLKRKPFPLPHRCCCFPPQCLSKNMNKLRVYKKIPKDYPDQQNIGMCAPVCIHTHTPLPNKHPCKRPGIMQFGFSLLRDTFPIVTASVLIRRAC